MGQCPGPRRAVRGTAAVPGAAGPAQLSAEHPRLSRQPGAAADSAAPSPPTPELHQPHHHQRGPRAQPGRHCQEERAGRPSPLCAGVSSVERPSARRQFRRLNRGGDRQANATLHRIVFTRRRVDPRTPDYYERRIKEGKTRREIVRCLKRYAARDVFHLVGQLQPGPRS
ncbi:transposase [Streptomyces caelestis]|uniref:transposase n=1 Tax=Streptomyces caelestis TaxID=36816 RepID=UPI0036F9F607